MKKFSIFAILISILLLSGCASFVDYTEVSILYNTGEPDLAYDLMVKQKDKFIKDGEIVYSLDSGMIAHSAALYESSNTLLSQAENRIKDSYTESVTANLGSYIVSENTREYDSPNYEDIYCSLFKSLNYYHLNNIEDAMVEIRRLNDKVSYYEQSTPLYHDERVIYDDFFDTEYPQLTNSALGHYLATLFSFEDNDVNYFEVSKKKLKSSIKSQNYYYVETADSVVSKIDSINKDSSFISFISFSGLSPLKTSVANEHLLLQRSYIDDDGYAHPALYSYLVYTYPQQRFSRVSKVEVEVNGLKYYLTPFENIGRIAYSSMLTKAKAEYSRAFIRLLTRELSKAIATASDKDAGKEGSFSHLFSLGVDVFSIFAEQPDLRASKFFPNLSYIGMIDLKPGTYDINVNFLDRKGNIIKMESFENYKVVRGKANLIESYCSD